MAGKRKHNPTIALWKFLFSLLVLWRHAEIMNPEFAKARFNFIGGSIAIFFFFIVSGYLMTQSALKVIVNEYDEKAWQLTPKYIWEKVKAFFPFVFVAIVASMAVYIMQGKIIKAPVLVNSFFDFAIIPQVFITHQRFLGIEWYISAMLVGMMILYPLIVKYKRKFLYLVSPLIALFLFSFMCKMDNGSYAAADVYYFGFLSKGLLAALAGMSLGGGVYLVAEKIRETKYTMFARACLTLIQVASLSSIFFIVCIPGAHEYYDSIMIVLLFIGISIAFSDVDVFSKFLDNKFIYYLERISLPLYLNQMWIMTLLRMFLPEMNDFYVFLSISTITVFATSMMILALLNFIKKMGLYGRIRSALIMTECDAQSSKG